jgi:hypothetical protein
MNKLYSSFLRTVVILSLSGAAGAQTSPGLSPKQVARLTASDATTYSQIGHFLAVDGNTAVTMSDNGYSPTLYVFEKPSSGWVDSTESAKLVASNGVASFFSVAISGDTIVAGATDVPEDIYIFVRPPGGWTGTITETAILDQQDKCAFATISTSGDAVLATTYSVDYQSLVRGCIFVRPQGGWKTGIAPTAGLNIPTIFAEFDQIPTQVDDSIAVAGVPSSYDVEGALYLFPKPSSGWSGFLPPIAKLIASNPSTTEDLGAIVSLGSNTIVATAYDFGLNQQEVLVFAEPASGWGNSTDTAVLQQPPDGIGFADAAAVSANEIVVGAPNATVGFRQLVGAAYSYVKPTTGWKTTSKFNVEFSASDGAPGDGFGMSVAIGAGSIFIGAPNAEVGGNQGEGGIYVFGK